MPVGPMTPASSSASASASCFWSFPSSPVSAASSRGATDRRFFRITTAWRRLPQPSHAGHDHQHSYPGATVGGVHSAALAECGGGVGYYPQPDLIHVVV